MLRVAADLHRISQRETSRDLQQLRGEVAALLGKYDESIEILSRALLVESNVHHLLTAIATANNADLLTDLTAVFLARAEKTDNAIDRLNAFECAARAWRVRQSPETAWNRAVAMEVAHSGLQTAQAWRDYLAFDDEDEWHAEGERRSAAVIRKATFDRERRQKPLEDIVASMERDLLPKWAGHILAGRKPEAGELQRSERGLRTNGEAAYAEVIEAALSATNGDARQLAGVIDAYRDVLRLIDERRYRDAEARLGELSLQRAGKPIPKALYARIELSKSVAAYYAGRFEESLAVAQRVVSSNVASAFLRGNARWMVALSQSVLGRIDDAAVAYEACIREFDEESYPVARAAVEGLYAGVLDRAGEPVLAWQYRDHALRLAAGAGPKGMARYAGIANEAARSAFRARRPGLAEVLAESVIAARVDPINMCEAHVTHATVCAARGDHAAAVAGIRNARSEAAKLIDDSVRQRLGALADAAEGRVYLRTDPRRAAIFFDRAIQSHERERRSFRIADLLTDYARSELERGDLKTAEETLQTALMHLDSESRGLAERRFGIRSPIDADELFRLWTEIALRRNHPAQGVALAIAATRRASGASSSPTDPNLAGQLQRSLRPYEALLVFGETESAGVVWLITREQLTARKIVLLEADELDLRARDIAAGGTRAQRALSELHRAWIEPVEAKLARKTTVLIAPSHRMHGVPFAALHSATTGRMLLDEHVISIVTDTTALIKRSVEGRRPVDRVLLVAASPPTPGPLARLPGVQREIKRITELFPRSEVIRLPEKAALLEQLGKYPAVHISAHGFSDFSQPLLSYVHLPSKRGDFALFAGEIRKCDLSNVQLVFLSSCSGAARSRALRPQSAGLADAFAAAGARYVIAALWPIDDDDAVTFTATFYDYLYRSGDIVWAFNETQRALFRSTRDGQARWCSFRITGIPS